jgi:hypothetical protein
MSLSSNETINNDKKDIITFLGRGHRHKHWQGPLHKLLIRFLVRLNRRFGCSIHEQGIDDFATSARRLTHQLLGYARNRCEIRQHRINGLAERQRMPRSATPLIVCHASYGSFWSKQILVLCAGSALT